MRLAITTDTHYGYSNNTSRIHEKFLKKLSSESFDVLVHCGDIASHKQKQLYRSLAMFRNYLGSVPILFVLGNHDYWDLESWNQNNPRFNKKIPYEDMRETQRNWFQELGVHYLQDSNFNFNDEVIFYGYDGWYKDLNPPSNDKLWMPPTVRDIPINSYLNKRAYSSLSKILDDSSKVINENPHIKLVCVTHHSLTSYREYSTVGDSMGGDPRHLDFLSVNFDLVTFGHSHIPLNTRHSYLEGNLEHSCQVVNVGSNYDKPKYLILEI